MKISKLNKEKQVKIRLGASLLLLTIMLSSCGSQNNDTKLSPRFNHVYLAVADLDRSVAFYTKAFDLEVTNKLQKLRRTGPTSEITEVDVNMAFLKFPGQNFVLEIGQRPNFESNNQFANYAHIGIEVRDIEKAIQRLVGAGATMTAPITFVEADGVSAKNAFFTGPDGETLELMEMVSGEF